MSEKNFTPIYTAEDLAQLVAKHDREHPDHGHDCGCENGLLPMLRTYFDPPPPPSSDAVPPYIPPYLAKTEPRSHAPGEDRKPWLKQREDETKEQYDYRTSHSCYNCGAFIVDKQLLDLHENECSRQGKRDERWRA